MRNRILGFLDLLRLPATLQLSSWILLGTLLAFRDMDVFQIDPFLRVFLGAVLGIGGGMALNDWVDRRFDEMRIRKNRHYDENSRLTKRRPLVEGMVSSGEAALLTLSCLLSVILIASTAPFPRNLYVIIFITYFIFAELLYQKLRHITPFSLPIEASIFGLWPLVGYLAVSDEFPTLLLINMFVIAFFWEVCHNQNADIIDLENDVVVGLKTLPIIYGTRFSAHLILISSIIVFISSSILFIVGNLGPIYFIGAVVAGLFYLKSSFNIFKQQHLKNVLRGFSTAKKYAVLLFIMVLLDTAIKIIV